MIPPQGSVLVTGANGGLASAIVAEILRKPELTAYTGIFAVRSAEAATQLKLILDSAPKDYVYEIVEVDHGSIASVKSLSAEINARVRAGTLPPIRALILSAAYQDGTTMNTTEDGIEITWQINYLSNFILTLKLLESLDKTKARILLIGSWSHDISDRRNDIVGTAYKDPRYTTLFPGAELLASGKWSTPAEDPSANAGYRRYGASKLCALMFMVELSRRLAGDPSLQNISIVSVDPGAMPTDLGRRADALTRFKIYYIMPLVAPLSAFWNPNGSFRPTAKSATDAIRAVFEIESPVGEVLYLNGSEKFPMSDETESTSNRAELWQYSVQASKLETGDTILASWA